MVIVKNPKRGRIGPSLRGLFYAYETEEGFKISTWPKKRGKPKSEAQAQAQQLFKDACNALKRVPAPFLNYAREQAKGTPMLPRDYLMAAGYGRGRTLFLDNGERRVWMATRVDLSILLDNIGWEPGMMLYRGNESMWVALDIGEGGQVLTASEDGLPLWSDPPAGGGGQWRLMGYGSLSTRAFATKGVYFNPLIDGEIDKLAFRHDFGATEDIRIGVYRCTGTTSSTIQEILYDAPYAGVKDGTDRTGTVVFEEPIPMLAEQRYVIAARTVGLGNTYATRLMSGGSADSQFPVTNTGGYAELANDTPVVGSSFATITGTFYHMMCRGNF